ncbi:MAG: pseudouridine synthase [Patescibacteria group bacterium]
MDTKKPEFPMRINKYLAVKQYCTRREADEIIKKGKVFINGKLAKLGDKVSETDVVDVKFRAKKYRYFAYHKARGIITHSPQGDEKDIAMVSPIKDVFPIGRLDKDSYGLIILTDDGRITDKLLNPDYAHEKEYRVTTAVKLRPSFKEHMEKGVDIGGYRTKKCRVEVIGERMFTIVLTEGKKHQIRRMCAALHNDAIELVRTRIMNIRLGNLPAGGHRAIEGAELAAFLKSLGF